MIPYGSMSQSRPHRRQFINARNLREEAKQKLKDYDAIMGEARKEYEKLRTTGIPCRALLDSEDGEPETIHLTRQCWNHVFKHPVKRKSKVEKIERALAFPLAAKLLKKTTTYQQVSREKDKGGNRYLSFGIIGYVRGNQIKVIIRRQEKSTNPKKVLFSFYQMSARPIPEPDE